MAKIKRRRFRNRTDIQLKKGESAIVFSPEGIHFLMSDPVKDKIEEMVRLENNEIETVDVFVKDAEGKEESWSTLAMFAQLTVIDQMAHAEKGDFYHTDPTSGLEDDDERDDTEPTYH